MLRSPSCLTYNYYNYYQVNKEKYRLNYEHKKAQEEKREYVGNYYVDYWKNCKWKENNI